MQNVDINQSLMNLVIAFAAFVGGAISLSLLYAAFLFIFCADDSQQEYKARKIIGYCILGGIVGLGAITIAKLITGSIVAPAAAAGAGANGGR
jgi:hypothetical protein